MTADNSEKAKDDSRRNRLTVLSGIGRTLFLWFLAISIVPMAVVSLVSYRNARRNLRNEAVKSLSSTIRLKEKYVQAYFLEKLNDLRLQSDLSPNISFLQELRQAYLESGTGADRFVKTIEWARLSVANSGDLRNFLQIYGYYDVFLIDADGNILFTVMGEDDLGTNIFRGRYADTKFGSACRKAFETGRPVFSDMELYTPSNNAFAMFMVQVMVDEEGDKIGLMGFQVPINPIDEIIQDYTGLGETGETYLVGDDLFMRSNSRFSEKNTALRQKIDTEATRKWLRQEEKAYSPVIEEETKESPILRQKLLKLRETRAHKKIQGRQITEEDASVYTGYRGENVLGIFWNLEELEKLGLHWGLIAEISEGEAFGPAKRLLRISIAIISLTIVLIVILALGVTNRIVHPIIKITNWSRRVASGTLSQEKINAPGNEIGELNDSFRKVVDSFQAVTDVCENIAVGDFSRSVELRSENDLLGRSVNQMAENLRAVVRQAKSVAKGDYSAEIIPKSEKDELGTALVEMTSQLSSVTGENERQNWFKTGETELNKHMRGVQSVEDLGRNVITFLAKYINARIGAFYTITDEYLLKMTASYTYRKRKGFADEFNFGEGLVGQAASENKSILITEVPDGYMRVDSGLGNSTPGSIVVVPFTFWGKVTGVIELGTFGRFEDLHIEFLENVAASIGIAVNTSISTTRTEKLLEKTRGQAEQLQVQQEELRQTNEELEEHTRALKDSEQRLQQQQEELRVTNEELEERTKTLEEQRDDIRGKNADLKKIQDDIEKKAKELEIASKYKSEFLANMSHELRTPLNSILVLSQLLSEDKTESLSDKHKDFAETIHSSGNDLLSLINEVLDLSKVEAGKMEIMIEEMDLEGFSDNIKGMFSRIASDRGLDLSISVAEGLPKTILTDPQRVWQIVKNLLSNAFKFTEKGGVELVIRRPRPDARLFRSGLEPAGAVAFDVSDTGVGIPEGKQAVIFEAFQQADGTTSRKYGGTGLGLSISRELAKLIGGEIQLKSEEGKGTTFTLYLPEKMETGNMGEIIEGGGEEQIEEKEEVASAMSPIEKIKDDRDNIKDSDKSILIIEDDPKFCKILSNLAHKRGFKCLFAEDGETGLHFADFYKPSAIILDVGLPGMDGWEVMDRLKDSPATRHIPVHFITAADKSLEALKKGAIGYITKPVDMDRMTEVFKRIEDMISRPVKKLLVVEDDEAMRKMIAELIGNGDVEIVTVSKGKEAYNLLKNEGFDCVILDLGLADISGFDLLEKIRKDEDMSHVPVIIYTGKDLSMQETAKLKKYSESIIIKGARSLERLLDETTLFLHRVESNLPPEKQEMLRLVHNKEELFESKKILIVDDDMRNVFALTSVLEGKGVTVVAGRNGREGIDMLEKNIDIDLVIMDIMMPEMNGYEAMRKIRKQRRFKKLPIIALTAKAMKGDKAKCIDAGASDYLSKPVDTHKLLSLLRVWLYNEER